MFERRRRHHAPARHEAVRQRKQVQQQHEEDVRVDQGCGGQHSRGRPDVAQEEKRDKQGAREGECEEPARVPDDEAREGEEVAPGEVAEAEDEEVHGAEEERVEGGVDGLDGDGDGWEDGLRAESANGR